MSILSVTERKITDIRDVKEEVEYIFLSRDVVHKHSKAIRDFLTFYVHFLEALVEKKKRGADVVLVAFTDHNFVYACDAIPIDYTHMVRLCTQKSIKDAEEYFHIPAEVCQMSKGEIGAYYEFKDSFDKILFGSYGCELQYAMKSLMEPLGYQTFLFDTTLRTEEDSPQRAKIARDHMREELEREAKWINGKGINKAKLQEEIYRANRLCDKVVHLMNLQKKHPTYMGCLPSMLVYTGRAGYYGQPEEYEKHVDAIIAEFESLPEGSYNEKRTSLVWSGARGVDFSIYLAMDLLGARICAWDVAGTGTKKYDETIDPLESYLDFVLGKENEKPVRGFPVEGLEENLERVEKLYQDAEADGVYINIIQGCTHGTMRSEMLRQSLAQKGIPTLGLNVMQQSGESTGQMITRLKAFIEMLS